MFSKIKTVTSTTDCSRQIAEAREQIASAECIIICAGAGLSTAAGLRYDGPDFEHRFADFIQKYGISDLYSSSFFPSRRRRNIGLAGLATSTSSVFGMWRHCISSFSSL